MDRLNYVYIVFRLDGSPCYVGKGRGDRWKRHKARAASNPHFGAILNQAGGSLPVSIVASGLTETEAFALESLLTNAFGIESEGGPLVNCGHGGRGGPSGVKHSEERRAKRRLLSIAMWRDETYRAQMMRSDRKRSGNKQPRSKEFRATMSDRLRGNTHTLGMKHSEATREKMRARWCDPEWRAKEIARRRASGMYSPERCAARIAKRKKL